MSAAGHLKNLFFNCVAFCFGPFVNYNRKCRLFSRDLFSSYVLFSHFRLRDATRGNSFFQMSSYARANVLITNEKKKKENFHEGITWYALKSVYTLKRSILDSLSIHLHLAFFLWPRTHWSYNMLGFMLVAWLRLEKWNTCVKLLWIKDT